MLVRRIISKMLFFPTNFGCFDFESQSSCSASHLICLLKMVQNKRALAQAALAEFCFTWGATRKMLVRRMYLLSGKDCPPCLRNCVVWVAGQVRADGRCEDMELCRLRLVGVVSFGTFCFYCSLRVSSDRKYWIDLIKIVCCLWSQVPTCSRSCFSTGLHSNVCVSLLTANADAHKIEMIVVNVVFLTNISSSEHILLDKVVCYHLEPIILRVQLVCHLWPQVLFCSGSWNSVDLQSIVCVSLLTIASSLTQHFG